MHKLLIPCIIIILVIIGLNILSQNYTNNSVEEVSTKLSDLKTNIVVEEKEEEKIKKDIENIMGIWKDKYQILAYFIEHDELEKVETELTALKANIDMKEYIQSVPDIDKSIFILNHIKDKFKLEIKNIF